MRIFALFVQAIVLLCWYPAFAETPEQLATKLWQATRDRFGEMPKPTIKAGFGSDAPTPKMRVIHRSSRIHQMLDNGDIAFIANFEFELDESEREWGRVSVIFPERVNGWRLSDIHARDIAGNDLRSISQTGFGDDGMGFEWPAWWDNVFDVPPRRFTVDLYWIPPRQKPSDDGPVRAPKPNEINQ